MVLVSIPTPFFTSSFGPGQSEILRPSAGEKTSKTGGFDGGRDEILSVGLL